MAVRCVRLRQLEPDSRAAPGFSVRALTKVGGVFFDRLDEPVIRFAAEGGVGRCGIGRAGAGAILGYAGAG